MNQLAIRVDLRKFTATGLERAKGFQDLMNSDIFGGPIYAPIGS